MIKRIVSLVVAMFLLAGCAGTPQQQNVAAGAAAGAAIGALVGNRTTAAVGALVGGTVGAFVPTQQVYAQGYPVQQGGYAPQYGQGGNCRRHSDGATINASSDAECRAFAQGAGVQQSNPGLTPQQGGNCRRTSDGATIFVQSEAECQQFVRGTVTIAPMQSQYPYQQQPGIMPQGAVCGAAAMHMTCPSLMISGTNCRRCQ